MNICPIGNISHNNFKDEEDDLFTNKKDYRNSTIDLGMHRPLHKERHNHRVTNSPYYDFNWYDQHNEIQPTFEEYNNNNNNYNNFIRDFNMIHPFNQGNYLLYPPDYNNSLLHPPNQNNFSFYDENGELKPEIRNIQEYYQNHRDSDMFYNPLRSDNIIHRTNHENSSIPPIRHSFSFLDDNLRNNFTQHPNLPLTPIEEFRQALRIQRKKKKKKKKR
jgi:hypothetical protein